METNIIVSGQDHTFRKTIMDAGIGVTSHTGTLSIKRISDGQYWDHDNNQWDGDSGEIFNDLNNTEGLGYFFLEILATSDFFDESLVDAYEILCTYRISNSTPAVVASFSESQYIRTGTPIDRQEIVDTLSLIPSADPLAPTSVSGMIQLANRVSKLAHDYDFVTYAKAVMFFFDEDYPFTGDPILWRYVYNASRGKPTQSSEIVFGDRVRDYSLVQPT